MKRSQVRYEAREFLAVALLVLGPVIAFWLVWADAPAEARTGLLVGVVAGAIVTLVYVVDRMRRGSFFIRDQRETAEVRRRMRSMIPLFVGIGILLYVLARAFPDDLQRLGAGLLIGLFVGGVPLVVANYVRVHTRNDRG